MAHYRGLTKHERAQLRNLNERIETMHRIIRELKFQKVMILRHVPPRAHRKPTKPKPRPAAQPRQPSLF